MRLSALVLGALAAAAAPATADAALFCVDKPPCTGGSQVASFKAAVDAANSATTDPVDRIEIGAGTKPFTAAAVATAAGLGIRIVGAGRGQTILTGAGGARVLTTEHADTVVSDLTIALPAADNADGVRLGAGGLVERVDVTGQGGGGTEGIVLWNGADATDIRSLVRTDPPFANYAIQLDPGSGQIDVTNAELQAMYGYYQSAAGPSLLRRGRITAEYPLFTRNQVQVDADGVLVRTLAGGDAVTVGQQTAAATGDTVFTLRHATLVGDGSSGQTALYAWNQANTGGTPRESRIVARDVIVSGIETHSRLSTANDGRAEVNVAYSTARNAPAAITGPFDSHEVVDGPGLIPPPADPGFNADFSLKPTSPYVDLGEPGGLSGAQSPVDLLGAPRIADGNGDGTARRDIGAFEYQPPPPPQTTATPPATTSPVTLPPPQVVIARPFAPRLLLALPSSLRLDRRGRLILPVECPRGGAACVGRIQVATAAAIAAQRRRRRFVTIGTVAYRVPAGRRARLVIRVSAKNRALIRRRRSLRVVARATASDGGATRKAFTLRPARRRR